MKYALISFKNLSKKADEITFFCFISSFPTVTRWRLVQMTHRVVFSTFAATKSWRCTATTISFAVSPRWPLASPVDYSWLDMTITIATFGIRSVANEQVNNYASNFTNPFLFFLFLYSFSRKGQLSARGRMMPPSSCTTSEPTRSWLSILTITSFAGSLRWPSASPADYSWLAMTTLTSTFGTH